jgi:hypothetical protein
MATVKPPMALDPVADLRPRIRGRQGAALRKVVLRWWDDQELGEHPAAVGKRIALALLQHRTVADKTAGILVLEELLADHLRTSDLPAFAALFEHHWLRDARVVDGFGMRVLGTLLRRVRGRAEAARALAQWRLAGTRWQRRAACVGFTALAPQGDTALPGLTQLVFTVCSTVVWSADRVDQTAVGWLLCELSRGEPTRVEAFIRRHARFMSRECVRHAVGKLPAQRQQPLLAHWKRATTLRR